MKKGESKIIRQQTGFNEKTKRIIGETQRIDEEIEKVKKELTKYTDDKVEHDESNASIVKRAQAEEFENRGGENPRNSPNIRGEDIRIVKFNEMADYLTELRLLLQVFEDRASRFLFRDKYLISVALAKEIFQSKLQLSQEAAHKLARFLIEPSDKEFLANKSYTSNSRDLMIRVEELVGKYKKYDSDEVQKFIDGFFTSENEKYRNRFINELEDLA